MTTIMIVVVSTIVAVVMVVIVAVPAIVVMSTIVIVSVIMVVIVRFEGSLDLFGEALFGDAVNFADGDSAFGRHLGAGLELRCEQRTLAVSPAELALQ